MKSYSQLLKENGIANNTCLYDALHGIETRDERVTVCGFLDYMKSFLGDNLGDIQIGPDILGAYLETLGLKVELVTLAYKRNGAGKAKLEPLVRRFYGNTDGHALHDFIVLVTTIEKGGYGAGHYYLMDGDRHAELTEEGVLAKILESNGGSLRSVELKI